jgi:hypothetical protein
MSYWLQGQILLETTVLPIVCNHALVDIEKRRRTPDSVEICDKVVHQPSNLPYWIIRWVILVPHQTRFRHQV